MYGSYVGTVYLLTSTVFLPLFASLADVWGRHWALQLSLAFFMVGSAISTGSHSMATMLVGRGIAGIGSAGMMAVCTIPPYSRVCIDRYFRWFESFYPTRGHWMTTTGSRPCSFFSSR